MNEKIDNNQDKPEHLQEKGSMVQFIVEQARFACRGKDMRDKILDLNSFIKKVISDTQDLVLGAIQEGYVEKTLRLDATQLEGEVQNKFLRQELRDYLEEEERDIKKLSLEQERLFDVETENLEKGISQKEGYFYTIREELRQFLKGNSELDIQDVLAHYEEFVQAKEKYEKRLNSLNDQFLDKSFPDKDDTLKRIDVDGIFFQGDYAMGTNIEYGLTPIGEFLKQMNDEDKKVFLNWILGIQSEFVPNKNRVEQKVLKKVKEISERICRNFPRDIIEAMEARLKPEREAV